MGITIRAPRLTSADLELLRSMWPEGTRHSGPAADVFAASGNHEWPGIVVSRRHGGYAMADAAGRTSTEQRCLASMLSAEYSGTPNTIALPLKGTELATPETARLGSSRSRK
jgi:hypothetical protein